MTKEEQIAVDKYNNKEKYSVSTFIDEDTIIAGYGKLDIDFEFPLPSYLIVEIYGTQSWMQLYRNKGLFRYLTTNTKTKETAITPYLDKEGLIEAKKENKDFTFEQL